jgi:lipase ATG15
MGYLTPSSQGFTIGFDFYRRFRDNASDWVRVPTPRKRGGANFHHFFSPSKNLSLIAIRGTDVTSPHDFLQNVYTYSEVFIFQLLAAVVPLSSFLPEKTIVDFVAASGFVGARVLGGNPNDHHFYEEIESYVQTLDSEVVLTGHSLGGVVARIVGARLRKSAVGFSGPGITLVKKKFGMDADAIDAYTTNIIASNDMIAQIDRHGGALHHVQCEHLGAAICHSVELHTIRMWSTCPQFRQHIRVNGSYTLTPQPHIQWVKEVTGKYLPKFS